MTQIDTSRAWALIRNGTEFVGMQHADYRIPPKSGGFVVAEPFVVPDDCEVVELVDWPKDEGDVKYDAATRSLVPDEEKRAAARAAAISKEIIAAVRQRAAVLNAIDAAGEVDELKAELAAWDDRIAELRRDYSMTKAG